METFSNSPLEWVEHGDGFVRLAIDTALYPETSIFRTCYLFTDRAYLYLRAGKKSEIIVEFRAKKNTDIPMRAIVGEFGNELLNQRIRLDLAAETRQIRELIVTQAFSEADFNGES